jgi:hypothetical protein
VAPPGFNHKENAMSRCPAVRLVRYSLCAYRNQAVARGDRVRARCLIIRYSLFALVLVGLTLGYALRPTHQAVAEGDGATGLAERLAGRNGWEIHADPMRPRHVFFLVDPNRRDPAVSLSFLRQARPGWDGVLRMEVILTIAGEVEPAGGFVWRGLWFYGDQGMLDRIRPDLR